MNRLEFRQTVGQVQVTDRIKKNTLVTRAACRRVISRDFESFACANRLGPSSVHPAIMMKLLVFRGH
jgi:hypothetical protein